MKKLSIGALLVALAVVMAGPAQAAFTVGGENGWQLSTDGIVNIFGTYQSTEATPAGATTLSFLNNGDANQKFGVRVGLLPSIIAFNVKAPTTAGIDSNVRAAMYVNVQNSGNLDADTGLVHSTATHYNTDPNIDFREFYYTAKGKFGEFLAGRALNLFQGQNILNDMTLFTAGVVDAAVVHGGTSLGHIAYGYLYANFGPQFRYTTPDMGGFKVAMEIGEPYAISRDSAKTNIPRLEAELSYATTFKNGSLHAWLGGLWQQDTRSMTTTTPAGVDAGGVPFGAVTVATPRAGGHNTSLGIAPGVNVAIGPVGLMVSGYYGRGLGVFSTQDGDAVFNASTDDFGNERHHWGFLGQATYQVTDSIRVAGNYGRCDVSATEAEGDAFGVKKTQEAAVAQLNYNLNKFTQFTLEYIWARDSWFSINDKMTSHQFALGTVFFW